MKNKFQAREIVMFKFLSIFLAVLFFLPCMLFAQDVVTLPAVEVGLETWVEGVIALIKLIKGGTVGGLAIASAVLALVLQTLKLKILKPIFDKNRLLVFAITTLVGVAISTVALLISGLPLQAALIASLFTGGGALAIYSAFRAAFKKE